LQWSTFSGNSWISVAPATAQNDATVFVTINRQALQSGQNTGFISISSNGGAARITVTATGRQP
jgi:hypothetical protein